MSWPAPKLLCDLSICVTKVASANLTVARSGSCRLQPLELAIGVAFCWRRLALFRGRLGRRFNLADSHVERMLVLTPRAPLIIGLAPSWWSRVASLELQLTWVGQTQVWDAQTNLEPPPRRRAVAPKVQLVIVLKNCDCDFLLGRAPLVFLMLCFEVVASFELLSIFIDPKFKSDPSKS